MGSEGGRDGGMQGEGGVMVGEMKRGRREGGARLFRQVIEDSIVLKGGMERVCVCE